jgi:hypothetical protein
MERGSELWCELTGSFSCNSASVMRLLAKGVPGDGQNQPANQGGGASAVSAAGERTKPAGGSLTWG